MNWFAGNSIDIATPRANFSKYLRVSTHFPEHHGDLRMMVFENDDVSYLVRTGVSVVACEGIFQASHLLLKQFPSLASPLKGSSVEADVWAVKAVNLLHAMLVGPLALWAMFRANTELAALAWAAINGEGSHALFSSPHGAELPAMLTSVTVGFFIWDLLRINKWIKSSRRERMMMVTHHVLSIGVWPIAVHYRTATAFLLHYELTELSSPLLQLRWFIGLYYGRGGNAENACAAAFAAVFLLLRATNVHLFLAAYVAAAPWSGVLHHGVPAWVRALATCTLPLPAMLNILWSYQIFKMGSRMLGLAGSDKASTRNKFSEEKMKSKVA